MELFGISFGNFFLWGLFGFIVGYTAQNRDRLIVSGGSLASAMFGCAGAILGGCAASFLLGKAMVHFSFTGLLTALAGAFLLSVFYRISFSRGKRYIHTTREVVRRNPYVN